MVIKQKKSKRPKQSRRSRPSVTPYMQMIADPCSGPLVGGFYGTTDGYISRLRSSINFAQTAAGSPNNIVAGYVLWAPSYTNAGSTNSLANVFVYQDNTSTSSITNVAASPMFALQNEIKGNPGYCKADPATNFTSLNAGAYRTVAACMQFSTLARLDGLSGEIAFVDNIPWSTLFPDGASTGPSVDTVFRVCQKCDRISFKDYEIRYRPQELDDQWKTDQSGFVQLGLTGSTPTTWTGAETFNLQANMSNVQQIPNLIGFAYRGFAADAINSISGRINMFKVVEWQPVTGYGVVANPSTQVPSKREKTVSALDRVENWTTQVHDSVQGAAVDLGQALRIGNTIRSTGRMLAGMGMRLGLHGARSMRNTGGHMSYLTEY